MFIDRAGIRDQLRLDDICGPTGLHKHIVPTGLKTLPQRIYTLKLTPMGFAHALPDLRCKLLQVFSKIFFNFFQSFLSDAFETFEFTFVNCCSEGSKTINLYILI